MEVQTPRRRRVAGVAFMVAGALGLVAAVPASAQEEVEGNPTCGDLAPEGVEWTEFKVEPVTAGPHTDGVLEVNITLNEPPEGQTFNWTSNIPVSAVFAKGGPGGNLYEYDPPVTSDTGLHAPATPSGKWADLSHVSFCYEEGEIPPPPPPDDEKKPEEKPEEKPEPAAAPTPAAPVVAEPTFTG
jgi:hypothetical protein